MDDRTCGTLNPGPEDHPAGVTPSARSVVVALARLARQYTAMQPNAASRPREDARAAMEPCSPSAGRAYRFQNFRFRGVKNSRTAAASSPAVAYRPAGSFAMALRQIASSPAGIERSIFRGGVGAPRRISAARASALMNPAERLPAGQHLIEDHAETVDAESRVLDVHIRFETFRRRIGRDPAGDALGRVSVLWRAEQAIRPLRSSSIVEQDPMWRDGPVYRPPIKEFLHGIGQVSNNRGGIAGDASVGPQTVGQRPRGRRRRGKRDRFVLAGGSERGRREAGRLVSHGAEVRGRQPIYPGLPRRRRAQGFRDLDARPPDPTQAVKH